MYIKHLEIYTVNDCMYMINTVKIPNYFALIS